MSEPRADGAAARRWLIARVGFAQLVAFGSTYYLPAVLAQSVARDLGVPAAASFAGLSAALVVSGFLGPAVGRYVDRHGGRLPLTLSNLVFAAGLAIHAAAQGPVVLGLAWLVMGVGMALGYYETAFAALARLYGASARGQIAGVTLIAGLTSTVSWPLTAWMDAHVGWRLACLIWAAVNLIVALPLNLSVPKPTGARTPLADRDEEPDEAGSSKRAMIALAVMYAATSFVASGLSSTLPTVLGHVGIDATTAIWASTLLGPAQVVGRLAEVGWLGRYHPIVSASVACAFLPLGVAAFAIWGPGGVAAFAILFGIGNGLLTIARGTLPLALFGPRGYGRRVGVLTAPSRVTGAVAPLLMGLMTDAIGAAGLVVAAALNVVGLVALAFIRRERH